LGGLHKKVQITPPAFNEFKIKNMKNDCELIAKKNKIEFCWNDKFPINSINIMRGYLLIKSELKEKFIDFFFDAYWKDNKDLNNIEEFNKILEHLKINSEEYSKAIQDDSIKQKLKDLTDEAFNKEIFGAPTFVVNNKLFWGQDRLEYAIDELENLD
jgi:2-hydroxychromene-2-carboxylate isomerase